MTQSGTGSGQPGCASPSVYASISRPLSSIPRARGASNPAFSRKRSSAWTAGVHGPARRLTVSPTRVASFRFPPMKGSSSIPDEANAGSSRASLSHVLAVAPADLAKLPSTAGVYLFIDARGHLLYVGRASNLRSRVRSYWNSGLDRPGLRGMVRRIRRVLAGPCISEHEAALLERTLLERLDPPFNRTTGFETVVGVRLSSTPPGIAAVVDLAPRIDRVFGPYLGWAPTYAAASALMRLFPVHFCRPPGELDSVERDLARIRGVGEHDLDELSQRAADVLERDRSAVIDAVDRVRRERERASELCLYERASELQRQIEGILWITQRQDVMRLGDSGDRWIADEWRIDAVVEAIG